MASSLPDFAPFDASHRENIATRWQRWFTRFENLLVALDIKEPKRKRALLLHYMGESTLNIFETLPPDEGDDDEYKKTCRALNTYFKPQKNTSFEIFKFRKTTQNIDETIDQFHVRLVQSSRYCEFANVDTEIKAQIELGTNSKQLRRYAFRHSKLTLSELLEYGRIMETAEKDARGIEKQRAQEIEDEVNAVRQNTTHKTTGNKTCFQCGYAWPHVSVCPAKGKTCNKCKKPNHFARCCNMKSPPSNKGPRDQGFTSSRTNFPRQNERIKQVEEQHEGETSNSDSDEFVYTVHDNMHDTSSDKVNLQNISDSPTRETVNNVSGKRNFFTQIKVNDISIQVNIDSGASVNIIDGSTFTKLSQSKPVHLKKSKIKLFAYGSTTPLDIRGHFEASAESAKKISLVTFYVINGNGGCLLSGNSAIDLGLLKLNNVSDDTSLPNQPPTKSDEKPTPNNKPKPKPKRLRSLFSKYDHLFQGVGKFKDYKVHLHIDQSVPPTVQQARKIPFAMRKKVSKELKRLESLDIIESVKGPTTWVSPIVCFPKPNNPEAIRLCIDMRVPNKAILRERHPTPTTEDLIHKLNGAAYFSKLDLSSGYHQLELDQESRDITTFATHKGLKRFKRLNFGTNSAAEIFQNVIQTTFQDIEGCINISDDILVFAKTQEEHDKNLAAVLQRADEKNLRFNDSKCEFDKQNLSFYGHVFSADGISPCPKKIEAIKSLKPPTNVSELRSYLGMITYCGRFIKDLATLTAPLRQLTKKSIPFVWKSCHQQAFEKLQASLTQDAVLAYFDLSKQTELVVDASPTGLAAILLQFTPGNDNARVVAYGSRALTEVEQRYSQTEREALAIVFGCEHFRLFLYGIHFTLYTDHKPLEIIFENPRSNPPARLERWRLRLQSYNFQVKYRPGHDNPSDYMSRHPIEITRASKESLSSEQYIQFIGEAATPKAMTLDAIKNATLEDTTLQAAAKMIRENSWYKLELIDIPGSDLRELKLLRNVKNELTVSTENDLILRGTRIVVPTSLRADAIRLAHVGHQGIVKTKSLLREKVWFPKIDSLVEEEIRACIPCQATGRQKPPQPLQMRELPSENFDTVYIDFLGPLPTGETLLVLIDGRSRYPEVKIMKKTDASSVITRLNEIFSTFGLPKEVISDNGPPFKSDEMKKFMKVNGIRHRTITPLWPQANEAETFMKPLMKAIRTAHVNKQNWRHELHRFLLNYRATPHATTQVAPAKMMFYRNIRMKLPQVDCKVKKDLIDESIENCDQRARQRMKEYADQRRSAKQATMKIGDCVLVKQKKNNKLTTNFDPRPLKIIKIKGTMITAERPGYSITRNQSFFKLVDAKVNSEGEEESHDDDFERQEEDREDQNDDGENRNEEQNLADRRYPERERRRPEYMGLFVWK